MRGVQRAGLGPWLIHGVAGPLQAGVCVGGSPVPGPAGTTGLAFSGPNELTWAPVTGATGYDLVRGTVSTLLVGGDFTLSTDACVANDIAVATFPVSHTPAAGDADWFLVRAYNACGTGTFDDGSPSQVNPRDAGIEASPNACP